MAASILQRKGGTSGATAPASYSVTLDSGTTNGSRVVIVVVSDATVATPSGFALDKSQVNSNGHYVFSKATTGGETGWTVSPNVSAAGVWYAAEVAGLTATPLDQTASTGAGTTATTRSTGTTGTTAQAAEIAIASWGSSVLGTAVTWGGQTNGFTEDITDQVTTTGGSNVALSVATLILSTTQTVESTATADAGEATKSTGIMVTYAAAGGSTVSGDASLAVTAGRTAAATLTTPASAAESVTATLSADATLTRAASATATTTATLSAAATVDRVASATLTVTASLLASGSQPTTPGRLTGTTARTGGPT